MQKYVDLHLHTCYSDGAVSPIQVIWTAKVNRLDRVAISDHDSLQGYFAAIKEAETIGITLVPGVELTTLEHHLLALNFDPHNERFNQFVKDSQNVQKKVCKQRIEVLEKHGVPITYEKVCKTFPEGSLGKMQTLKTMLYDKECREYLETHHENLEFMELFRFYLGAENGIAAHVLKKGRVIHWDEAVEEVHKADGLAIFAHPSTKTQNPIEVLDMLRIVDGIEVQPKYEKETELFVKYAQLNDLKITYGSDFHQFNHGSQMLTRGKNLVADSLLGVIKR